MRVGIIAKLIEDRKFGFIETDHFRDDVFFHQSCLEGLTFKRLYVGQEVEFEINEILRMDEDKLEATIVKLPRFRSRNRWMINLKEVCGLRTTQEPVNESRAGRKIQMHQEMGKSQMTTLQMVKTSAMTVQSIPYLQRSQLSILIRAQHRSQ